MIICQLQKLVYWTWKFNPILNEGQGWVGWRLPSIACTFLQTAWRKWKLQPLMITVANTLAVAFHRAEITQKNAARCSYGHGYVVRSTALVLVGSTCSVKSGKTTQNKVITSLCVVFICRVVLCYLSAFTLFILFVVWWQKVTTPIKKSNSIAISKSYYADLFLACVRSIQLYDNVPKSFISFMRSLWNQYAQYDHSLYRSTNLSLKRSFKAWMQNTRADWAQGSNNYDCYPKVPLMDTVAYWKW
jgi:hypothetical protein